MDNEKNKGGGNMRKTKMEAIKKLRNMDLDKLKAACEVLHNFPFLYFSKEELKVLRKAKNLIEEALGIKAIEALKS